jgi:hypothetical protein
MMPCRQADQWSKTRLCALFDCLVNQPMDYRIHFSKFKRFHETKRPEFRK